VGMGLMQCLGLPQTARDTGAVLCGRTKTIPAELIRLSLRRWFQYSIYAEHDCALDAGIIR